MGISGLLSELKDACEKIRGAESLKRRLGGRVAGIDGHSWLHQRLHTVADHIYLKADGAHAKYVTYFTDMITLLLDAKIMPLIVFDGMSLPAKKETDLNRQRLREAKLAGIDKLLLEDENEARKRLKRYSGVTEEMVRNVILNLRAAGIPHLVAPYEADAQLAFLAEAGIINFAIAEDSDLVVYGVKRILFKLKRSPVVEGDLFEADRLKNEFRDPDFMRKVSILSGCDYLSNLPGIGLKMAIKFMKHIKSSPKYTPDDISKFLKRLPVTLNKRGIRVTDEYCSKFLAAEFCFKHQLVYCPISCHFVPLSPYPVSDRQTAASQSSSSANEANGTEYDDDVVIIPSPHESGDRSQRSSPQSQPPASSSSSLSSSSSPSARLSQSLPAGSAESSCCAQQPDLDYMISQCGSRLSSPELEYQHALGKVRSKSLHPYADDDFEPDQRDWLTEENVQRTGLYLINLLPHERSQLLTHKVTSKDDEMHADFACSLQEKGATLPSVSIDAGKEDRNEKPAKNSLQGQECKISSSRSTAPPNPAAKAASKSKFCHESGLERPTPVTQSVVSHGETLHPNSASKGAAIETTPTRSGKRAMSFPDTSDAKGQELLLHLSSASSTSRSQKRKGCMQSSYFSPNGVKRRSGNSSTISPSPSPMTAPWRLPTVPSSTQPFLPPEATGNPSRRSSSLPPAGIIQAKGNRSAEVGASSCVVRAERKSETLTANNNKQRMMHMRGTRSEGMKLRPPVISRSLYFEKSTSSSPLSRFKSSSHSSLSCTQPIRLQTGRLPLDDRTNIRGVPALKFVQMQSHRLFTSIHSPSPPPPAPTADRFAHRLPTGRRIEDEDVGDIYWTGRSSGKTPSPPLLRLPSPHHPRSGNSSIVTLTAASTLLSDRTTTTTTTQISGDSGYSSSSAS